MHINGENDFQRIHENKISATKPRNKLSNLDRSKWSFRNGANFRQSVLKFWDIVSTEKFLCKNLSITLTWCLNLTAREEFSFAVLKQSYLHFIMRF